MHGPAPSTLKTGRGGGVHTTSNTSCLRLIKFGKHQVCALLLGQALQPVKTTHILLSCKVVVGDNIVFAFAETSKHGNSVHSSFSFIFIFPFLFSFTEV